MNLSTIFTPLVVLFYLLKVAFSNLEKNEHIFSNRMFAMFDPYVSILDKDNPYRYNVTDLLPLVILAASRFSRLLVSLEPEDLDSGRRTGASLSPSAIAQYNKEFGSNYQSKVEVWIAYYDKKGSTLGNEKLIHGLQNISNEANLISADTVTTILFPSSRARNLNESNFKETAISKLANLKYKLGVLSVQQECHKTSLNQLHTTQNPYFIQYTFTVAKYFNNDETFIPACPECKLLTPCNRKSSKYKYKQTGFIVLVPDTYQRNPANVTQQVSVWKKLNDWSIATGNTIIISKVFDTPYEQKVEHKTSGWWKLVENPEYDSTSEYNFTEKHLEAESLDFQENHINFDELEIPQNISTASKNSHVGVIFSVAGFRKALKTPYLDTEIKPLMAYLPQYFSSVLFLIDHLELYFRLPLETLRFELQITSNSNPTMEMMLLLSEQPSKLLRYYLTKIKPSPEEGTFMEAAGKYNFDPNSITMGILSYIGENTTLPFTMAKKVFAGKPENPNRPNKLGYSFAVSICRTFDITENREKQLIMNTLGDIHASVIVFYFIEDGETVKLGAERMFQQRVVELEQCKRFMEKNRIGANLSITFVMKHYATEPDFYKNPWDMQTYVRYWNKLTNWAENTRTTLIMNNAIDGARYINSNKVMAQQKPVVEIGWWRYDSQANLWIDKRQDTIRVAKLHFEKIKKSATKSGWDSIEILLVALAVILFFIVLIGILFVFARKRYRNYLSKTDIANFMNGCEGESYLQIPYDKSTLEIDTSSFRIEEGGLLGSGEFGIVCKGQILEDSDTKPVAIKMANPQNICVTTIKGLLSEIKVLSFVGKHRNVVELLGANTVNARLGKVFIFFEYCGLGSLETYLRKQREMLDNDNQLSDEQQATVEKSKLLDMILPKLYCWSRDICNGMAYLVSKEIVHRDLATRNVLLNLNEEAKISDFGLSKRMRYDISSGQRQQGPMPWKWMAPESLRLSTFNEKTDVWAYGITLWEIYSLGDTPYPGLSFVGNFAQKLELGFRLGKPQFNERGMYNIMQECWTWNPDSRPSFSTLQKNFDSEYLLIA